MLNEQLRKNLELNEKKKQPKTTKKDMDSFWRGFTEGITYNKSNQASKVELKTLNEHCRIQRQTDFVKSLDEWKQDRWILFAANNYNRFWCDLNSAYKVTTLINKETKLLYLGASLLEAYDSYIG